MPWAAARYGHSLVYPKQRRHDLILLHVKSLSCRTEPLEGLNMTGMKIAAVVYDGLTFLDLVGCTDALWRLKTMRYLPDLDISYCGMKANCRDNHGFEIAVDTMGSDLGTFDVVFVPGGFGSRTLLDNAKFIAWIQTAAAATLKTSVCTGSLILGAAGLLEGRRATTHFDTYDTLYQYTSMVEHSDVVEHGDVITAGAVGSSILLGLHLCRKWTGPEAAVARARSMGVSALYEQAHVLVF